MMKWWLDKGVRGFRIDAIMNIKKPFPLRNYNPDREDGMVGAGRGKRICLCLWAEKDSFLPCLISGR